MNHNDIILEL